MLYMTQTRTYLCAYIYAIKLQHLRFDNRSKPYRNLGFFSLIMQPYFNIYKSSQYFILRSTEESNVNF